MELPEVEIVCEEMRQAVLGKQIESAWGHPSKKFVAAKKSAGASICGISRHGKYILIKAQAAEKNSLEYELIIHLGMSGSLNLRPTSREALAEKPAGLNQKHIRARWFFADDTFMELRDVRRFGYVFWVRAGDYSGIPTLLSAGPDALSCDFTTQVFFEALQKSQRNIKAQLLGQKPVAGLGNIYIDEALWSAGISPKAKRLGQKRAETLRNCIVECLKAGLKNGGTTLRDYRTFSGDSGDHQNHLKCYGRGGKPCLKCGTKLAQEKIDGRGTTYCKTCQK